MDELYRPIEGYPGYEISSTGEVRSCWSRYRRPCVMTDIWLPLKPVRRRCGHLRMNLSRDGKKSTLLVHRLVLEAWVGPRPSGLVCCHNNGLPWDNRVENLRWDTHQSNSDDALLHGRRSRGSKGNSKLREEEVVQIRRLRAEGATMRQLASRFGISHRHTRSIVSRRSWRHLPDDLGADCSKMGSVALGKQEWRGIAS